VAEAKEIEPITMSRSTVGGPKVGAACGYARSQVVEILRPTHCAPPAGDGAPVFFFSGGGGDEETPSG